MDEEEFLKFLYFKKLKEAYTQEKKLQLKKLEQDYESNRDFLESSMRNAIEEDRKHREMVNVCVAPFTEKGSLVNVGFKFIRASPLSEFHIPNVDFLIFKQTPKAKIAIFGEAKGSISSPEKILSEFRKRIEIINQNQDYIKTNYLKLQKDDKVFFEYVIAVPSGYAPDVLNKVIENGGRIIVWHAPITGPEDISIAFPTEIAPNRASMMHRDHKLNEALNHAKSNRKMFNFFPQVHPLSKLQSLLSAAKVGDEGHIIIESELKEYLSQDLFYMDDAAIEEEVKSIIDMGLRIGFLETTIEKDYYHVKARGNKRDTLERQLVDKWIKNQLDDELKARKYRVTQEVQAKYKAKRLQEYRTLRDFEEPTNPASS